MISTKKKIYITLFIFSLLIGVLIRFGFFPVFQGLKESSQELLLQKKVLDLFRSQVGDLENFQRDYSLFQPVLEKLQGSFVDKEVPIDFIEFLERETTKAGLSIKIFPFTVSLSERDPWLPVAFSISAGGVFSDYLRFLERLEQSSWLTEISQLNIERITEKSAKINEFETLKVGNVYTTLILRAFSEELPPKK